MCNWRAIPIAVAVIANSPERRHCRPRREFWTHDDRRETAVAAKAQILAEIVPGAEKMVSGGQDLPGFCR